MNEHSSFHDSLSACQAYHVVELVLIVRSDNVFSALKNHWSYADVKRQSSNYERNFRNNRFGQQ